MEALSVVVLLVAVIGGIVWFSIWQHRRGVANLTAMPALIDLADVVEVCAAPRGCR